MLALPNTVYLVPTWITYCTKLITDCFCAFDVKPKAEEDPYVLLAEKVGSLPPPDV